MVVGRGLFLCSGINKDDIQNIAKSMLIILDFSLSESAVSVPHAGVALINIASVLQTLARS
jgi:hypothetical protein